MSRQAHPPVLVLRALGLGDGLTGAAALRGVRRAWPRSTVVLAGPVGVGDLLRQQGLADVVLPTEGVDAVRPLDAAALEAAGVTRGHVAVNLHGRGPQSHRALLATGPAELVAFRSDEAGHADGPPWRADEHEVERWCRLVRHAGGRCGPRDLLLPIRPGPGAAAVEGAVVLHPGAASASRRWPVDRWQEVAAALAAAGHPVVVTGGPQERSLCAQVATASPRVTDLAGALAMPGLSALVATARLVVCGDTGVAHLATAWRTPSVLLFGPTPPRAWGPAVDLDRHTVLWHGRHGDPMGDPHADEVDPRLARIGIDEVLAAAEALLPLAAR